MPAPFSPDLADLERERRHAMWRARAFAASGFISLLALFVWEPISDQKEDVFHKMMFSMVMITFCVAFFRHSMRLNERVLNLSMLLYALRNGRITEVERFTMGTLCPKDLPFIGGADQGWLHRLIEVLQKFFRKDK